MGKGLTEREMENKAAAFWHQEALAEEGAHVLAAVSGGADSVCLLRLLLSLREKLGITLSVFHYNHCLRESAGRDEAFVKALCEEYGIPFYVQRADVKGFAEREHLSVEEAARLLRYQAAEKVMDEIGARALATAHQQMDQAETLLFSLCRGSGLEGMGGIRPRRDRVIRPLLWASRSEIEDYLKAVEQSYMTDETNADEGFSRNLIRGRVLPLLTERINANTVLHLAQAAEKCRSAYAYIQAETQKLYQSCLLRQSEGEAVFSVEALLRLDPFLASEIIRLAITRVAGSSKDVSGIHVEDTLALVHKQSGLQISLPYNLTAQRSFDELSVTRNEDAPEGEKAQKEHDAPVTVSKHRLTEGQGKMTITGPKGSQITLCLLQPGTSPLSEMIPPKGYTKWLDYDKIEKHVTFRHPREGDYFYFDPLRKKSATAYFQQRKLPMRQREQMLVMAEDDRVLVFFPDRMSADVKLTEETVRILEVSVEYPLGESRKDTSFIQEVEDG